MEWKTVAYTVLIVGLCFLAIPIRVGPDTNTEDIKLFSSYVTRYNKSYRNDPAEYEERFKRFKGWYDTCRRCLSNSLPKYLAEYVCVVASSCIQLHPEISLSKPLCECTSGAIGGKNAQRSLRHIEKMNGLRSSQESAYYGLTAYSDMSEEEFLARTLVPDLPVRGVKHVNASYHRQHRSKQSIDRSKRSLLPSNMPLKFDWREKGVVTPVREQGSCGACWAFSTVEVAESMFAITNGTLRTLSVQEMIDCARNGNFGCEGGDICSLLSWLLASKVEIFQESSYPLTRQTSMCKLSKRLEKAPGIRIKDFTCDSFRDAEDDLLVTLATHGPVAAAVNALSWQNYLGGVIQYHCDGSFDSLNHAVQIVGYDKSATIPHYIVKNSWGSSFGDKGYIYIGIGGNLCGTIYHVLQIP